MINSRVPEADKFKKGVCNSTIVISGREDTRNTLKDAETPPMDAERKDANVVTGKLSKRTVKRSPPESEITDGMTLLNDDCNFWILSKLRGMRETVTVADETMSKKGNKTTTTALPSEL